jgi:Na+/melibiose symporter-like transporter
MFFYLKNIVKTSAAPTALLVGQISDGIATPIVGYFSDRTKTKYGNFCIFMIGQRTPWYIFGLVLVLSCFIPLFQKFTSQNKNI